MIENYPVKTDSVGRLVIPKEIRNKCNIDYATKLIIIEKDSYILLEKANSIITVDSYGRVLIPKELREKYNIFNDQELVLSTTTTGIKVKAMENKYQKIIAKLLFLENSYNFKFILISDNNNCIYLSNEYNKIEKLSVKCIEDYLSKNRLNYAKKKLEHKNDENLILYIIYEDKNKYLLDLIYTLLE